MKRYVCTVATGLLLALVSTGSAAAGVPLLGNTQQGSQSTSFGDQSVGEQKNDADVNQAQGNGNVNVSPAIAIFGDATTWNAQGNGNTAVADVDQSNTATQSQDSRQNQDLEQSGSKGSGHCCGGQSQTGEQSTDFGDQTVDKQKNEAEVNQAQGNGNVNVSPAIAVFGDASTKNAQGNGNTAVADVEQDNTATQSQSSSQSQSLEQGGSSSNKGSKGHCCGGQSQTGEQSTDFGDQTVDKQKNEAEVNQAQGNGNLNISPAIAIGGHESSCSSKCGGDRKQHGGASTFNAQGNGNVAQADVDQSNVVTQSQTASQTQSLGQSGGSCCKPRGGWKPPENGCKPAPTATCARLGAVWEGAEGRLPAAAARAVHRPRQRPVVHAGEPPRRGRPDGLAVRELRRPDGRASRRTTRTSPRSRGTRTRASPRRWGSAARRSTPAGAGTRSRSRRIRRCLDLEPPGQRQRRTGRRRPGEHGRSVAGVPAGPEPGPGRRGGEPQLAGAGAGRRRTIPAGASALSNHEEECDACD